VTGYSMADLNKDGKTDLFQVGFYGEQHASLVSLNDGSGHFGADKVSPFGETSNQSLRDYRLGDFRNTGNLDLVLVGDQNIRFQPGNGDGTFGLSKVVSSLSQTYGMVATADFNKDGKLDFVVALGSKDHTLTQFLGNGDGRIPDWL
jgi:hypothetical protein